MPDTAYTYYTTESLHGNYQYLTLTEIVDAMVLRAHSNPDSNLHKKTRDQFILEAKFGIKELSKSLVSDVLALELEVGDDLTFVFPQDYVDWVRVSKVGPAPDYNLLELDRNTRSHRATTYLQDHNYNILFAENGDPLEADGSNVFNKPLKRKVLCENQLGGKFQTNTANYSKHGEFLIDKRRGQISLDSDLVGQSIVLEYISDGLQWEDIHTDEITVHKYYDAPLRRWVEWNLINNDMSVPERSKMRAERLFYAARSAAAIQLANIKVAEVSKVFRSKLKWVKT